MKEQFRYNQQILDKFSDLVGGVIYARGMEAGQHSEELSSLYEEEQAKILRRYKSKPLSEIPSVAAWRRAFRAFGVNPTKYRSASEALLRRLTKKGNIPSINILVDIANLVSIRYALPVAIFDTRQLTLPITVLFAEGNEEFLPLGQQVPENPVPGEVIFTDERGDVIARRWCWRQSANSAADRQTSEALVTIESQHASGEEDVEMAVHDLNDYFAKFTGGTAESAVIHP